MTTRFSWASAMRLGLGVLRLPPQVFWAMTPREFEAAVSGALGLEARPGGMTASTLQTLMDRFPDRS
jgi:uncharacterized phage protein (TIGR02216 family)